MQLDHWTLDNHQLAESETYCDRNWEVEDGLWLSSPDYTMRLFSSPPPPLPPPPLSLSFSLFQTLSLAYYFSGDERYASKAVDVLEEWFLKDETKMNPNLNFAQGVPGRLNGSSWGIIDTV